MKKLIYSIIALLIIIPSWFLLDLSRYLPPDIIFTQGIKYESEEIQTKIAKTLDEKKIPFRINDEGFIEYRKKDNEKVKKIANEINIALSSAPKVEQPPPNINFSNPETHKMFVELLEKEGIPYKVVEKTTHQGVEFHIEYGWKDYVRVKRLIRRTISEVPIDVKT